MYYSTYPSYIAMLRGFRVSACAMLYAASAFLDMLCYAAFAFVATYTTILRGFRVSTRAMLYADFAFLHVLYAARLSRFYHRQHHHRGIRVCAIIVAMLAAFAFSVLVR